MMPGLRANPEFTDEQLAAIATYVRNAWGNGAPPVAVETVATYRESVAPAPRGRGGIAQVEVTHSVK